MPSILLIFAFVWFLIFWRMRRILKKEGYDLSWPQHFYKVFTYLNDLIDTTKNETAKQEAIRLLIAFHASFMALGIVTIIRGLLIAGILAW